MELVAHPDNLREAFLRAARGKSRMTEVQHFRLHVDEQLERMGEELLSGSYRFGAYHTFEVYEPKKRIICAASFRDRVAMHAMMRICHPVFDGYQVFDSYASRVGKGTHKAIERVRSLIRPDMWFAKLDACVYFSSIDHAILLSQLHRLFKDVRLLSCFGQLIATHSDGWHRGLPIGNLTSQYFANHYLAVADHYLKEQLHAPHAIRYMDDTLLLDTDRSRLLHTVEAYTAFVGSELHLSLHEPVVNRCVAGIPFLGYVVHPHRISLNTRSRHRFRHRLRDLTAAFTAGHITETAYQQRLTALYAVLGYARAAPLCRSVAAEQGLLP